MINRLLILSGAYLLKHKSNVKCISERPDVDCRNIIKKMLPEEITYNSIIKIF